MNQKALNQKLAKHASKDMEKKTRSERELETNLNTECDVKLLRREVIAVHNILSTLQYKLGDAVIVLRIIEKLKPHAAVDTNITPESHEQQVQETGLTLGKKAD